ncbi:MAG TPA: MFS transporter [Solirubrobacteraceae bacterium]|jgi:inositol transporter-like SP family MFS transporter
MELTRDHWRNTILAGLANYIDAGSIVAGAAGLALWTKLFHLSSSFVGIIGAFSSNAISAGVGALVGGWLCDRWGRKKIYQWDLLIYAFGLLWIIFASAPWMLVFGYVLAGLAVGADVPASWTLIAETAPDNARGKMAGVAQVLWMMGPVVVLVLALALSGLGILGIKIVFGHLFVLALVLWAMRRGMRESKMWAKARETAPVTLASFRELLGSVHLGPLLFLTGMYGLWNLMAGTNGFYLPYILRTVGAQSQAMSVGLQACSFLLVGLGVAFVFMPLVDRVNQKRMFMVAAVLQIFALLLFALFPLGLGVAIGYVVLLGIGGGFGQQPFFQLWSGEMFPTMLRSTAQGLMFAVVRIGLGIWSFFVPAITAAGFHTLAWILTGFLVASALLGLFFAPSNAGKSLAEIQEERGGREPTGRFTREPAGRTPEWRQTSPSR